MKIMALGDTHGNRGFTKSAITWASENEIDHIVQVGDFGFWPRLNNGQTFLHDVGKHSLQLGVPLSFLDGNHEDHDYLNSLEDRKDDGSWFVNFGKKYPLRFIVRGARWNWDGVWFGAFGGAFSIDRRDRIERSARYGWFRQEMPDESRIPNLGKVDVLFTHDAPIVPPGKFATGFKRDETSMQSQRSVYEAMFQSKPDLLIHGHWHHNERYKVHGTVVQALDCDDNNLYAAAVVFDTDGKVLYNLHQWEHRDGR